MSLTVSVYKDPVGRATRDVHFDNAYLHMSSNGALVVFDATTKQPRVIYADGTWHIARVNGFSY